MPATFYLEIITPERKFFEGQVEMVIVDATDGKLAVQSGHVPMVVSLETGEVSFKADGQWQSASSSGGFMEIRPDETIILAQAVEWPYEIDENRARAAAERANERLRQQKSMQEYQQSKAALARALVRLRVSKRNINNE